MKPTSEEYLRVYFSPEGRESLRRALQLAKELAAAKQSAQEAKP